MSMRCALWSSWVPVRPGVAPCACWLRQQPHAHCGQRPHTSGASQRPTGCGSRHTPNGGEEPPHLREREPRHYQVKNL